MSNVVLAGPTRRNSAVLIYIPWTRINAPFKDTVLSPDTSRHKRLDCVEQSRPRDQRQRGAASSNRASRRPFHPKLNCTWLAQHQLRHWSFGVSSGPNPNKLRWSMACSVTATLPARPCPSDPSRARFWTWFMAGSRPAPR